MTVVPITSADLDAAEVSWFSALCSDDYRYLGAPDGDLRSSWAHCLELIKLSEELGFRNILCPSSYQVGQDTLSSAAGCTPITSRINLLAAVRRGEMQPIMLARAIATLDHMLQARLTVNIISLDFPGETADSAYRYRRSREVVQILRQAWTRDEFDFEGEIDRFKHLTTAPGRKPISRRRTPALFRRVLARCARTVRRTLRCLSDVAGKEGRARAAYEGRARARGAPWPYAGLRPPHPYDRARH